MSRKQRIFILMGLLAGMAVLGWGAGSDFTAERLLCEYMENPLGIDVARPRLSWQVISPSRGQRQSAYRILVASSREKLLADRGDLWDTGKVDSSGTIQIPYGGKPLLSYERCYWKVRSWDKDGRPSPWSEVALWSMGILQPDKWQAKWIGYVKLAADEQDDLQKRIPSPIFRNTFAVTKCVRRAEVYISGLGYYELYINGHRIGDHVLDPAFTRYDRRVLYVTYDVTDRLLPGRNALGVMLGNGWLNVHTRAAWNFNQAPWRSRPRLLFQMRIEYSDGSVAYVKSDDTWRATYGPVVQDGIREGEHYDARREPFGWTRAGFDDAKWDMAQLVSAPKGKLSAQMMPPIKITRILKPVKLTEPKPGVFVYDLGQNIAGFAEISVSGPAGTKIGLLYGERLKPDGTVEQKQIKAHTKENNFQYDTYILEGKGRETWHPRFVYQGFQYVQVSGFPGRATLDNLRGMVVHTAFSSAGSFVCSNELLNRIQEATRWSYRSNFHGYPTDCPHREKNGWTGDAHLAAEQAMYNFQNCAAYTKWMNDFFDEQRASGELPGIVPTAGWGYQWGNGPAWDSAYLLIPWYMYMYQDDTRILAKHYDRFKRYVDYLTSRSQNHIVGIGLGDWVPAKTQTPAAVTSTGYYYVDTRIVARIAKMLGKQADAEKYSQLAEQIKKAFNQTFYKGNGIYANGSQTALSCALYQGLVEPSEKAKVLEQLVANIRGQDYHIDTGILGAKYIFNTLAENGRADVAYRMAVQTTRPGYGWWIKQGATTLWEDWNGSASLNHIMFGDISAWFYKYLGGIKVDSQRPGFAHIIIHPLPLGKLTWVKAEHDSLHGLIRSEWRIDGNTFYLTVMVPTNTTATVYLPAEKADFVSESNQPANQAEGVQFLRQEKHETVYRVQSGLYRFAVGNFRQAGDQGAPATAEKPHQAANDK